MRRSLENPARRPGELSVAALSAAPATRALLSGAVPGGALPTLAKTVRSRCTSPVCILWSGYDEKAGEPAFLRSMVATSDGADFRPVLACLTRATGYRQGSAPNYFSVFTAQ
jgi:hypothetical protein